MSLGTDVGYTRCREFAEPPAAPTARDAAEVGVRAPRGTALRGGGDGRVDEDLYCRQLYVMGNAAQRSLARSTILLIAHPPHTPVPSALFWRKPFSRAEHLFGGRGDETRVILLTPTMTTYS